MLGLGLILLAACNPYTRAAFDIERGMHGYTFTKERYTKSEKANDLKSCALATEKKMGYSLEPVQREIVRCMEQKNWEALEFVVLKH